jgi:hypothetical protein
MDTYYTIPQRDVGAVVQQIEQTTGEDFNWDTQSLITLHENFRGKIANLLDQLKSAAGKDLLKSLLSLSGISLTTIFMLAPKEFVKFLNASGLTPVEKAAMATLEHVDDDGKIALDYLTRGGVGASLDDTAALVLEFPPDAMVQALKRGNGTPKSMAFRIMIGDASGFAQRIKQLSPAQRTEIFAITNGTVSVEDYLRDHAANTYATLMAV